MQIRYPFCYLDNEWQAKKNTMLNGKTSKVIQIQLDSNLSPRALQLRNILYRCINFYKSRIIYPLKFAQISFFVGNTTKTQNNKYKSYS